MKITLDNLGFVYCNEDMGTLASSVTKYHSLYNPRGPLGPLKTLVRQTAYYATQLESEIRKLIVNKYRGFQYSPIPYPDTGLTVDYRFDIICAVCGGKRDSKTMAEEHYFIFQGPRYDAVPLNDGTIEFVRDSRLLLFCSEECGNIAEAILDSIRKRRNTEWQKIQQAAKLLKDVRKLLQQPQPW